MSADTHVWLKLFNLTPGTGGTSVFHCAQCQETPLYYGMCVHVCVYLCARDVEPRSWYKAGQGALSDQVKTAELKELLGV